MTHFALRPYQQSAVTAAEARWSAGDRATLVLLPTGTGKTVVFSELTRRVIAAGGRSLVLAHRSELLVQARDKLEAFGLWAQLEQAEQRAGLARAVVASVQTLRGRRLATWARDAFDLVVVDEAHHASAKSYRDVLDHFASARVLGVTATGDRADGAKLGSVFDSVAFRYELRAAIKDGWLAPIRARRIQVDVDLDQIETVAGDLSEEQLGEAMTCNNVVDGVAIPLLELAEDRPTVLFAVTVAHARALAAALNRRRPGCALAVSGSSSPEERRDAAAQLATRQVQFVSNAQLWTEGFDLPAIACVALARPTKSRSLFVQMVGRGTRLSPGKHDCLVLDFTANTERHRLVSAIDVLGEELPDEVRRHAQAALDLGAEDVMDVVDRIGRDVQRQSTLVLEVKTPREHVRGWVAEDVHDLLDLGEPPTTPEVWQTATELQRSALVDAGISVTREMSRTEAARILTALSQRRQAGLATFKQVRWLAGQGIDAKGMAKTEATALIGARIRAERSGAPKAPS
ncbi:MAG: DEAD/DEAH box helicase [Kofleriaceae bacterium]|nr:DEAD/DEAH box helicase [Kofleriaceae bacterium]